MHFTAQRTSTLAGARPVRAARAGATLIELMVVIVIMLGITAIAIPVVAPALEGRELRESARLLDAAFARARNRAVELRRPAGVMFERIEGLPWACRTVSIVETPEPYTGDYIGSTMDVARYGLIRNMGWWQQQPGGGMAFFPDAGWIGRIRVGDVVKLGGKGFSYRIELGEPYDDLNGNGVCDGGAEFNAVLYDVDGNGAWTDSAPGTVNLATGYLALPPDLTASPPVLWRLVYDDASRRAAAQFPVSTVQMLGNPPVNLPSYRAAYQIRLAPVKAPGGEFQLLDTALVDLEFSGTALESLTPDPLMTPIVNATLLPKMTPVVLMFSPMGRIESIELYSPGLGRVIRLKTSEPFYFLIGRRDQIRSDVTAGSLSIPNNLHDVRNLWVSVGPTGFIATTECGQADQVLPANLAQLQFLLRQSRVFAEQAIAMGGR